MMAKQNEKPDGAAKPARVATVTVRWIQRHPSYGYFAGDTCELPVELAKDMEKAGYLRTTE